MSAATLPSPPPAAGRRPVARLLLVGDGGLASRQLAERLREWVPVTLAAGADDALHVLARDAIGFVVSDVRLPDGSGLDLCRALRAQPRFDAMPLLLVAADGAAGGRSDAVQAGAADYLVQPFGIDTLRRAIALAWPAAADRLAPATPATTTDQALLALARARLHEAGFGVRAWADATGLSERQLRRRILAATGQAPLAWLREERLQGVRRLIDDGVCAGTHEAGPHLGMTNRPYLRRLYRARFEQAAQRA